MRPTKTSALISAQAKDASDKGISGVPTFVFAQKYAVSGAQPAEQLARAIRQVSAEDERAGGGVSDIFCVPDAV